MLVDISFLAKKHGDKGLPPYFLDLAVVRRVRAIYEAEHKMWVVDVDGVGIPCSSEEAAKDCAVELANLVNDDKLGHYRALGAVQQDLVNRIKEN